jgi:DNA-binding SARP family transcriptional activator
VSASEACIDVLGAPQVRLGGAPLRFPDRKAVALLAVLALDGATTRARLSTLLWDEDTDADVRRNLRRELHRLREAGFEPLLGGDGDRLALRAPVAVDALRFVAACDAGQADEALALYRAPLLAGFDLAGAAGFQTWLAERRDALAQRWARLAEAQCEAARLRGDLRGALALALALVHADALQEGACCRAMALHAELGEREAALALFEKLRRRLGRELGLRPLPSTAELAEGIRSAGAAAIAAPARPATSTARAASAWPDVTGAAATSATSAASATSATSATSAPATAATAATSPADPVATAAPRRAPPLLIGLPAQAPLVGRDALLATIEATLQARRLVVLQGPGGIGKSRLLHEVLAGCPGALLHGARSADRRVPYAALARWLRARPADTPALPAWARAELARLLPEFGTAPAPLDAESGRLRLFEALGEAWRCWFTRAPRHLFDDWQHVDDASAAWWAWWQAEAGVPVLVALRPGTAAAARGAAPRAAAAAGAATGSADAGAREAAAGDAVAGGAVAEGAAAEAMLREALAACGGVPIEVPPLDADAVLALVRRLSGVGDPQRFAERLARATGGHPFYTLETMQHLLEAGVLRIDALGRWETPFDDATRDYGELPIAPSVQAAVAQRLAALGEGARRLLDAASLLDDEFALATVAAASALDEWGATQAVEEALQARMLVRDAAQPGRFRFEHDLIAQVAAAALSPERSALLHRALARRLAHDGAAPALVAHHHERAGERDAAREFRLRALLEARRRMVPAEVLAQAGQVLAMQPTPQQALRARLAQAEAHRSRAEPEASRKALAAALAGVGPGWPTALRVEAAAAEAAQALRDDDPAAALAPLDALLAGGGLDGEQRALLLLRRADALRALGRGADSRADLEAALAAHGDEPSVMLGELLDSLARTTLTSGDYAASLAWARRAAQVCEAADQPAGLSSACMMCGVPLMFLGRWDEAIEVLESARSVAARHGLVAHERGAILNLAACLLSRGERRRAIEAVDAGYALSRWFSSPAERQAFVEARYQCRVDNGELGAALELRGELVQASRELRDVGRAHSGFAVALDLPLLLGDGELAADAAAELAATLDRATAYTGGRACAKLGWAALVGGDAQAALALVDRGAALETSASAESLAYFAVVRASAWLALGQARRACDALGALPANTGSELAALFVAAALRAARAAGDTADAHVAEAERLLDSGEVPMLQALELLDALLDALPGADPGTRHAAEARRIAAALHASLAGHPRQQALFGARHARWLVAR